MGAEQSGAKPASAAAAGASAASASSAVAVGKPEAEVNAVVALPGQPTALATAVVDVAVKPAAAAAAAPKPAAASAVQSAGQSFTNTVLALTAGGCAGALSRTATSPLERLKVMKQIQSTGNAYAGTFQALAKMYREEGVRSYWKGNGTNVVRIAPYSAIQFWSFDHYKRWLMPAAGHEHTISSGEHTVRLLTAGALAGATSSISCYPLDLVRSVLTVQTDPNAVSKGLVGTLRAIYAAEGLKGCYRGLTPTLLGIAPYVAINFAVFDTLKTRFLPDRTHQYFDLINLALGACSGATAAALTYPSDVIRRRMQLQGLQMGGNLPAYAGTWDCIRTTVRMEGVTGLYKGLSACLLKVIPSVALSWATYERLKAWWKFAPPPKTISAG